MDHMKTATVRELRDEFPRIEAWLHEGESITISKRGKVIATLVPAQGNALSKPRPPKVDIMARLRETWGDAFSPWSRWLPCVRMNWLKIWADEGVSWHFVSWRIVSASG